MQLGRALAETHRAGADTFGGDDDGFIGTLPLPNRTADTWPEFYATRRVLPYLKAARDRSAISADDAEVVEAAMRRIDDYAGPTEPPARIHGDLWSGNVLWGSDGAARLIDPAAHGGHRETDLAMLALFGSPHLARLVDAYDETAPLAEGCGQARALSCPYHAWVYRPDGTLARHHDGTLGVWTAVRTGGVLSEGQEAELFELSDVER